MPYNFVPDSFHTGVTAEALRAKIERNCNVIHYIIKLFIVAKVKTVYN